MTNEIQRPCYATRESVKRAIDAKSTAYNAGQIDRQIVMGSEEVDDVCKTYFYPIDATKTFDWPNFQFSYPWRIWFDQHGLIVMQQLKSGGVIIPNNAVFLRPENDGPPYRWLELNRSMSNSFGNGPTPQEEISIQGTWGHSLKTFSAGSISLAMGDTTSVTCQVTSGNDPGVGDVMIVDSERMIVQEKSSVSTGVVVSALETASPMDNQVAVPSVAAFSVGETLVYDAERLLIVDTLGSNLIVKRAWDGTILAPHTGGTLYALRQLTVIRGALGTTAATHLINAPVSVVIVPGLVKELALAYAVVGLVQESASYSGEARTFAGAVKSGGQVAEPSPGAGITSLEQRCSRRFGRVARTRVV